MAAGEGLIDVLGVGANSVDFVYRLPTYPRPDSPFAKVPIAEHLISCGGQVATALATCTAMGLKTAYIGTIGSDEHGDRMRLELRRRGIDLSHTVSRTAPNPFAVILLDDREGERVVLWHRDARAALTASEINPAAMTCARLVHVDDVDLEAAVEAAHLARAAGKPVTSDIERTGEDVRALIDAVTIPLFAEHVPTALTGETDLPRALERLRRPHHTMLGVTLGARGALLVAGQELLREPAVAVDTVDTTGAGDTFDAGFLHAWLDGAGVPEALRFGAACAALSTQRAGGVDGQPTSDEVERALAAWQAT